MALDLNFQLANRSYSLREVEDDNVREGSLSRDFECNICLDLAHDPVIAFCGHLYCWPCIYKWIHLQNIPSENQVQRHPQCPVCKTDISQTTLVPLYGSSQATNPSEVEVPERPPSLIRGGHALIATTDSHPSQQLHHRGNQQQAQTHHLNSTSYMAPPMLSIGGTTTNVLHPMIGETAYAARVSGNSSSIWYAYPNLYHLAGSSSLRMRRQELHADNSLGRLYIFLFCCVVICLIFL
ncbi:unnamed protein product [Withania somnifera]